MYVSICIFISVVFLCICALVYLCICVYCGKIGGRNALGCSFGWTLMRPWMLGGKVMAATASKSSIPANTRLGIRRKYDLGNKEIWPEKSGNMTWETKLVYTALLIAIYVGKCLNQNCADYKGINSKPCSLISQQCSSTLDCRRKSSYNGSVVSLTRCVILYLLSCVTQNYLSRPESTRGSRALS